MKIKYVELNSFFKEKINDGAQFARTVSIALGLALGRNTPVPQAAPEGNRAYYAEKVQAGIERQAAEFNENIIIDLDLAIQTARSIWMVRAGLAVPTQLIELPEQNTPGDTIVSLSGEGFTLDAEVVKFIDANREVVLVMVNRVSAVLASGEEETPETTE